MKKLAIYIIFFLGSIILYSQTNIDSLLNVINTTKDDTTKVNALNEYAKHYIGKNNVNANDTLNLAIELAQKIDFPKGEALAYKYKGIVIYYKGNIDSALFFFKISKKIYQENGFEIQAARVLNNMGIIYSKQGDLKKAVNSYVEAISILENSTDYEALISTYINAANTLTDLGNFQDALDYNLKALEIYDKKENKTTEDSMNIGHIYKTIGNIYEGQADTINSKKYYNLAFEIYKKYDSKEDIGDIYLNYGYLYMDFKDTISAKNNYLLSLKYYTLASKRGNAYLNLCDIYIREKKYDSLFYYLDLAKEIFTAQNSKKELSRIAINYGKYYLYKKDYLKAIEYFNDALQKAEAVGDVLLLKDVYSFLYESYKLNGQYKSALEMHEKYLDYTNKIFNSNNQKKLTQMSLTYEFEKQKREQEILYNENLKRQKIKQLFTFVILFLAFIIIGFMFFALRAIKGKNKLLEQKNYEINMQNEEIIAQRDEIETQLVQIEKQRDEIEKQRDQLEKKNRNIEASIYYALRIQQAMLPSRVVLDKFFPSNFIFFKPRDIVSGDFYWFATKGDKIVVTAADCTGHGVPGAFMSLLGISFLNQILIEISELDSAKILEMLRDKIIKTLKQDPEREDSTKDGMDMSLIVYDRKEKTIKYSGAYNSLYLVSDNKPEIIHSQNKLVEFEETNENIKLIDIKADRMPIGVHVIEKKPFSQTEFKLTKTSRLYLLSDGFPDLYNYNLSKKFSVKRFKKFVIDSANDDLTVQNQKLESIFNEWLAGSKQIDDVLVIGLEIVV